MAHLPPTEPASQTQPTISARWANISFWASELNTQNWGWKLINGTCGGHYFVLGKKGTKKCEELTMAVKSSSATITLDLGNGRSGNPPGRPTAPQLLTVPSPPAAVPAHNGSSNRNNHPAW